MLVLIVSDSLSVTISAANWQIVQLTHVERLFVAADGDYAGNPVPGRNEFGAAISMVVWGAATFAAYRRYRCA